MTPRQFFSVFLATCLPLAFAQPARAANWPVFFPMTGFSLLAPDYPPPPGGPLPYSQTDGPLQWSVGPWGSPGGRMPGFTRRQDDFATAAPAVSVQVTRDASGSVLQLSQNGAPLSCMKNGSPQEFDLFAEPNGATARPPRIGGYEKGVPGTPLDALTQLRLAVNISISAGLASTRKHCLANFANTQFSVILIDKSVRPYQTLFYQLLFSRLCGEADDIKLNSCATTHDKIEYFSSRSPFGANDFLPLLGQPWLRNGVPAEISVDLLPRLLDAVAHGPAATDHDPAHWALGGVYLGQSIYGDTRLSSRWRDVSLTATTN